MKIYDMIPFELMNKMQFDGYIRTQKHPTLPLAIYNYTERAQFSREWNEATLACRGLIVNTETHDVVARPFPKFFNWDEPKPLNQTISLDEPVDVTDKLDGSLGILYPTGSGSYQIASRGSFTSDQAQHATSLWSSLYKDDFTHVLNPNITYLFEIIYPENRIVVDYNGMDDIVLLGGVDIRSGHVYGPEFFPGWPGPLARTFPYRTLRQAVTAKPRAGREGFVVRSLSDNLMVKVKYDDYVSLHRIVTGLNEKEIWRRCVAYYTEDGPDVLDNIPDELHKWVNEVRADLYDEVYLKLMRARRAWEAWADERVDPDDRRQRATFARRIKHEEKWLQKALWLMYDGKDPKGFLWRTVEPKGDVCK